jgi:hypothetical protein
VYTTAMAKRARSWFRPLALILGFGVATIAGPLACDDEDDEIGTPCDSKEDCSGDLICDVHDGQGTCQRDHDH